MTERATVIDKGLNVRDGPGTTFGIKDKLDMGDKVSILERKAHWIKVHPDNGSKIGWVHSSGLRFDVPAPKPAPPPDVAPIEYEEPITKHDHGPLAFLAGIAVVVVVLLWLYGTF